MLIPTRLSENILYWHLVYNMDGSRVFYLDGKLDQEPHITRLNLEDFRHVLGWCSEASLCAGKTYPSSPTTVFIH